MRSLSILVCFSVTRWPSKIVFSCAYIEPVWLKVGLMKVKADVLLHHMQIQYLWQFSVWNYGRPLSKSHHSFNQISVMLSNGGGKCPLEAATDWSVIGCQDVGCYRAWYFHAVDVNAPPMHTLCHFVTSTTCIALKELWFLLLNLIEF